MLLSEPYFLTFFFLEQNVIVKLEVWVDRMLRVQMLFRLE